jgi:hypothetical protein
MSGQAINRFSDGNSSTTALGSSATFTGVGERIRTINQVRIEVFADQPSALDGVQIQFSNDNATWNITKDYTLPANRKTEFYSTALGDYVRVVYTNDTSAQTIFYLRTFLLSTTRDVTGSITAKLDSGIALNPAYVDVFSRIRISRPRTLFESSFITNKRPDLFDEVNTSDNGTIAYTGGNSYVSLTTTSGLACRVIRQSYYYIPYQPGKSRLAFITGTLEITGGVANTVARIGLFDDSADKTEDFVDSGDGFFFELSGTALRIVSRSFSSGSQVDTPIAQADWNIDRLDGTGPSGFIIDPAKRQIFLIEQEWLGVGSVIMGVVIDATVVRCHEFRHANRTVDTLDTVPYTTRASLPVRYEITSTTGAASNATMHQICSTVISEGGFDPPGRIYSANRARADQDIADTELPLMALRCNTNRARVTVAINTINVMSINAGPCLLRLYIFDYYDPGTELAPTEPLGGALNWRAVGDTSAVQYERDATTIDLTGATYPFELKFSAYYSPEAAVYTYILPEPILLHSGINGFSQVAVLTGVNPTDATQYRYTAALGWKEYE